MCGPHGVTCVVLTVLHVSSSGASAADAGHPEHNSVGRGRRHVGVTCVVLTVFHVWSSRCYMCRPQEQVPPMLGIWNTILSGAADATWVFTGWEGVEARRKGVELNTFLLQDYGIPYG